MISPSPLSLTLGENFCYVINFIGGVYVGGSFVWSFYIALFRVFFVKRAGIEIGIGIKPLLRIMIAIGVLLIVTYSLAFLSWDKKVPTQRMCTHKSTDFLDVLSSYSVSCFYSVYHRFGQAKFVYGGSILSWSLKNWNSLPTWSKLTGK